MGGGSAPGSGHYSRLRLPGVGVEHGIHLLLGIDSGSRDGGTGLHA